MSRTYLTTPRLRLRHLRSEDLDLLVALNSDAEDGISVNSHSTPRGVGLNLTIPASGRLRRVMRRPTT